jgi:hypothetical protein
MAETCLPQRFKVTKQKYTSCRLENTQLCPRSSNHKGVGGDIGGHALLPRPQLVVEGQKTWVRVAQIRAPEYAKRGAGGVDAIEDGAEDAVTNLALTSQAQAGLQNSDGATISGLCSSRMRYLPCRPEAPEAPER